MDNLEGQQFGKLTVIKKAYEREYKGKKRTMWLCRCECGKECYVTTSNLTSGNTKSCGCMKIEKLKKRATHGMSRSRLYRIWHGIKDRCFNPHNKKTHRYMGRGITVCDEWLKFENFYKWATENGYDDTLTIDRIDNDGNYCPENCRWASNDVQQNNRCTNHMVTYNGETKSLKDWSRAIGIGYRCLLKRINELKWSIDKAFNTPTIANKSSVIRRQIQEGGQSELWDNVNY